MSDALRQSALLLHGLSSADQQWLLAQLPVEKQALLTGYLKELQQMGLSADRELAGSLLANGEEGNSYAYPTHGSLRQADSSVVLQALGNEPAWLIGAVLSIEAWPWRESVYEGLDASKRERVKSALRHPLPEKLRQSLAAQVETRLINTGSPARSQPEQKSAFANLLGHIKRMAGI